MQSLATKNRIYQIVILVACAFLFYEMTNWEEGIWVAISAIVVSGPFSTFLGFEKARNRFLGTIAGLMIAACLEYYLRFNPNQVPLVAVITSMILAFFAVKDYKYMIIVITVCTCLGFTYMNMPFTSFEPMNFLISRAMGVFVGIFLFYLLQKFLFGDSNARLELYEESLNALTKTEESLNNYLKLKTTESAFEQACNIMAGASDLKKYYKNSNLVFNSINYEVIYSKRVIRIVDRAIQELTDKTTPNESNIKILLLLINKIKNLK